MERTPNTQYILSLSYGKDSLACLGAITSPGAALSLHPSCPERNSFPGDARMNTNSIYFVSAVIFTPFAIILMLGE